MSASHNQTPENSSRLHRSDFSQRQSGIRQPALARPGPGKVRLTDTTKSGFATTYPSAQPNQSSVATPPRPRRLPQRSCAAATAAAAAVRCVVGNDNYHTRIPDIPPALETHQLYYRYQCYFHIRKQAPAISRIYTLYILYYGIIINSISRFAEKLWPTSASGSARPRYRALTSGRSIVKVRRALKRHPARLHTAEPPEALPYGQRGPGRLSFRLRLAPPKRQSSGLFKLASLDNRL